MDMFDTSGTSASQPTAESPFPTDNTKVARQVAHMNMFLGNEDAHSSECNAPIPPFHPTTPYHHETLVLGQLLTGCQ